MDFLWAGGPASAEQVREGLMARHAMKDATVRTILRRLEEKGYAAHVEDGRTYIYSGVERPENVAMRAVRPSFGVAPSGRWIWMSFFW